MSLDPFHPTWRRALLAAAVAAIGFLLPQRVPLEYYPLNHPSSGLQYLQVTCAATAADVVRVSLDTGRRFNDVEAIRWPISPSDRAYTYTFPLPDAPIRKLRLFPFESKPGELTITRFRIINRRGQEIRRFSRDDFQRSYQIAAIVPVAGGWKIVTNLNATHPFSDLKLGRPLIAEGMSTRNLERCLLSWTYLALMIWILLLALYFTLKRGRTALLPILFLAFLALLFSAVGNRGLIKNSIRYALYHPPALAR